MFDAAQWIERFFDCWRRSDVDGAIAFLNDDAVFVPDPKAEPVTGRDAIRALWATYMGAMEEYDFEVRLIFGNDRLLCFERIERMKSRARGIMLELPIVSVFELDGEARILAWRDYWDPAMAGPH